MKVINSGNIEKWMFDYYEGNLSLHERLELERFVGDNPIYQADFEAWEGAFVTQEPIVYNNTDSLIKKGFFEDKKMLLIFYMLLGSGILLHSLIGGDKIEAEAHLADNKVIENNQSISIRQTQSDKLNKNNVDENLLAKKVEEVALAKLELQHGDIENKHLNSLEINNSLVKHADNKTQNRSQNNLLVNETNSNVVSKSATVANEVIFNKTKRDVETLYRYSNTTIESEYESPIKIHESNTVYTPVELRELSRGVVEYKKKKSSFSTYKSKTLSKSLSRMLNKNLSLTVYDNRLMLKDHQMSLGINSAFAGNIKASRVQANFERRDLFETTDFAVSYDAKLKGLNAGAGILISNETDKTFDFKQVDLFYTHELNLMGIKLLPAIKGGVKQSKVNWNNIGTSALAENVNDSINTNTSLSLNISPSIMIELPFAYVGVQANNLYSNTDKFVKDFKTLELQNNGSYSFVLGTDYLKGYTKKIIVSPQLYVDIFEDSRKTKYTFATTMQYRKGLFGVGYTNNKTFRGVVGLDVGAFRLAYNAEVDLDLYKTGGLNSLKHEVALQFIISKKKTGILLYD